MRAINPLPALVLAALVAACGEKPAHDPHAGHGAVTEPTAPTAAAPASAAADQTYQVRGRISALPAADAASRELTVAHDAIPDFVGATGQVVGMQAMTMSFPLASEVDLADLAAGDAVEMTLELRWQDPAPAKVTRVTKLPADTKLAFEEQAAQEAPATQ